MQSTIQVAHHFSQVALWRGELDCNHNWFRLIFEESLTYLEPYRLVQLCQMLSAGPLGVLLLKWIRDMAVDLRVSGQWAVVRRQTAWRRRMRV